MRQSFAVPMAAIRCRDAQPRIIFEGIEELAASLAEHGLLQPILLRPSNGHYELVAGERRLRAAQHLRWKEIEAVLDTDIPEDGIAIWRLQLVENAQRRDLHPVEEARAYLKLREAGMTQAEIARQVGKAQPTVANALRVVEQATPEMLALVLEGKLDFTKLVPLLPLVAGNPEVANQVATWAAERETPKSQLGGGLPFARELWDVDPKTRLVHAFGVMHPERVDWEQVCGGCPALVKAHEDHYGRSIERVYCLRAQTGYVSQVQIALDAADARRRELTESLEAAERERSERALQQALALRQQDAERDELERQARVQAQMEAWAAQIAGLADADLARKLDQELRAEYKALVRVEMGKRGLPLPEAEAQAELTDDELDELDEEGIAALPEFAEPPAPPAAPPAPAFPQLGYPPFDHEYEGSTRRWMEITRYSCRAECQEHTCLKDAPGGKKEPCAVKVIDREGKGFTWVCTAPGRQAAAQGADTREKNKAGRQALNDVRTVLLQIGPEGGQDSNIAKRFAATWALAQIRRVNEKWLSLAWAAFGIPWPQRVFRTDWADSADAVAFLVEHAGLGLLVSLAGVLEDLQKLHNNEYQKTWIVQPEIQHHILREVEHPKYYRDAYKDEDKQAFNGDLLRMGAPPFFRIETKIRVPAPDHTETAGEVPADLPAGCAGCGADLDPVLAAELLAVLNDDPSVPSVGNAQDGILTGFGVYYCPDCRERGDVKVCSQCGYSVHAVQEEERDFLGDECEQCAGEDEMPDEDEDEGEAQRVVTMIEGQLQEVDPAAEAERRAAAGPVDPDWPTEEFLRAGGLEEFGVEAISPLLKGAWDGCPEDLQSGEAVEWLNDCVPGEKIALIQFPQGWTARWTGILQRLDPKKKEAIVTVETPERQRGRPYNVSNGIGDRSFDSLRRLWEPDLHIRDRINNLAGQVVGGPFVPSTCAVFHADWDVKVSDPGNWGGARAGEVRRIPGDPARFRQVRMTGTGATREQVEADRDALWGPKDEVPPAGQAMAPEVASRLNAAIDQELAARTAELAPDDPRRQALEEEIADAMAAEFREPNENLHGFHTPRGDWPDAEDRTDPAYVEQRRYEATWDGHEVGPDDEDDRDRPLVHDEDEGEQEAERDVPAHLLGAEPGTLKCGHPVSSFVRSGHGSFCRGCMLHLREDADAEPAIVYGPDDAEIRTTQGVLRQAQERARETGEPVHVLDAPNHSLSVQPGGGIVWQSAQPARREPPRSADPRRQWKRGDYIYAVANMKDGWIKGTVNSVRSVCLCIDIQEAADPAQIGQRVTVDLGNPTLGLAERPRPKDWLTGDLAGLKAIVGPLKPNARIELEGENGDLLLGHVRKCEGEELEVCIDTVNGDRKSTIIPMAFRGRWPRTLRKR